MNGWVMKSLGSDVSFGDHDNISIACPVMFRATI